MCPLNFFSHVGMHFVCISKSVYYFFGGGSYGGGGDGIGPNISLKKYIGQYDIIYSVFFCTNFNVRGIESCLNRNCIFRIPHKSFVNDSEGTFSSRVRHSYIQQ